MKKIDKRIHYFLMLDIETANSENEGLAYDIGFAVCDKRGNIYEKYSYVVRDIFTDEREIYHNVTLMDTAYYAKKLPKYYEGLKTGKFKEVNIFYVRKVIHNVMEKYGIKDIGAYNANFDINGLNRTIRYISKGRVRWFFPYGTRFFCVWHMACQTICKQKNFTDSHRKMT